MPSQLSPPACNRYICTKSRRCSGSQALPLLLLAEPSRPFFGTGDSKEGGLFHTPLHEFFRRRLDGRKGAGGVGGCSAWVAWAAEAEAWVSASSRGRGSSDPEAGLALGVPSPWSAKPWECQALGVPRPEALSKAACNRRLGRRLARAAGAVAGRPVGPPLALGVPSRPEPPSARRRGHGEHAAPP